MFPLALDFYLPEDLGGEDFFLSEFWSDLELRLLQWGCQDKNLKWYKMIFLKKLRKEEIPLKIGKPFSFKEFFLFHLLC